MNSFLRLSHRLILTAVLLLVSVLASAEKQVADLTGEDREMYDKFRHLFTSGSPEEFYSYAQEYEKYLLDKEYMMLYYKLKYNEGFFALRHHQIYKAIQYAAELDAEVRDAGAKEYFYLATGLYGDIYNTSHVGRKAESYFMQALEEAGDSDPKFTMRIYMNLSEMLSLRDPRKALEWVDKSIAMAQETKNIDYLSISLGFKAYVLFLMGDTPQFYRIFDEYISLKSMDEPEFNHRYDNVVEAAKNAFDHDFQKALDRLREGNLFVDSSLCVMRIYEMSGDVENSFRLMRKRYIELDSINSLVQDANFNQLASETTLMRSREEAVANKRLAKQLVNWLIGMTVVFLFVYIMGRRRLMKKIWAHSKELKAALSRAEESDRMKSAFIQNMSHEIRTPLNAVAGFTEVLCSQDNELTSREKIDMKQRIASNVELITSIVNELLELSESESKSQLGDVEKTSVRCNDLCQSVLAVIRNKGKSFVELRFKSNVDDDFTIQTNPYRLRSSLNHLIDNAQKFTDFGHIELRFEHQDHQALFIVSDTGIGIPEKDRERIFENFAKLDEFKEGIGLGLPICRRLVASLGGTLELDPAYSPGSRFVITLPVG